MATMIDKAFQSQKWGDRYECEFADLWNTVQSELQHQGAVRCPSAIECLKGHHADDYGKVQEQVFRQIAEAILLFSTKGAQ